MDPLVQFIRQWIHFIFSISPSARSEMRAGDNDVVVEVLNIFIETTKENENSVSETIRKAIQNSMVGITGYTSKHSILILRSFLEDLSFCKHFHPL